MLLMTAKGQLLKSMEPTLSPAKRLFLSYVAVDNLRHLNTSLCLSCDGCCEFVLSPIKPNLSVYRPIPR